ncbi:MAG TPA: XylR N-terminal domain-containing protein [Kofleriaceae bacterium]|nr:XylR N-terminal domain-containing protein [Kofleriaceae bacterium]
MKVSDIDFRKMLEFSPETGRLLLGSDRLLLFRQEAFSALRKLMIEQLGDKLARGLLAQFGYRCGVGDHKALTSQYAWDTETDEMAAGPGMHMWEGIVHVEPKLLEFDRKTGSFHMIGHWTNSYEAEIHLAEFGESTTPVCHTLTGYASGWCTAFMGAPLVAIETMCVGKGDPHCAFEIKRPEEWGTEADPWKTALEVTDTSLSQELERKLREVDQYRETMAAIGTPIIQVWKEVVVLPVIGAVDARRGEHITSTLVRRVADEEVRCVLVDLTGVDTVDTRTADLFVKMARAVSLLGARCLITGVRPEVAQTLTRMGVELEGLTTLRSLKQGLEESLRLLGYTVRRKRFQLGTEED